MLPHTTPPSLPSLHLQTFRIPAYQCPINFWPIQYSLKNMWIQHHTWHCPFVVYFNCPVIPIPHVHCIHNYIVRAHNLFVHIIWCIISVMECEHYHVHAGELSSAAVWLSVNYIGWSQLKLQASPVIVHCVIKWMISVLKGRFCSCM